MMASAGDDGERHSHDSEPSRVRFESQTDSCEYDPSTRSHYVRVRTGQGQQAPAGSFVFAPALAAGGGGAAQRQPEARCRLQFRVVGAAGQATDLRDRAADTPMRHVGTRRHYAINLRRGGFDLRGLRDMMTASVASQTLWMCARVTLGAQEEEHCSCAIEWRAETPPADDPAAAAFGAGEDDTPDSAAWTDVDELPGDMDGLEQLRDGLQAHEQTPPPQAPPPGLQGAELAAQSVWHDGSAHSDDTDDGSVHADDMDRLPAELAGTPPRVLRGRAARASFAPP